MAARSSGTFSGFVKYARTRRPENCRIREGIASALSTITGMFPRPRVRLQQPEYFLPRDVRQGAGPAGSAPADGRAPDPPPPRPCIADSIVVPGRRARMLSTSVRFDRLSSMYRIFCASRGCLSSTAGVLTDAIGSRSTGGGDQSQLHRKRAALRRPAPHLQNATHRLHQRFRQRQPQPRPPPPRSLPPPAGRRREQPL